MGKSLKNLNVIRYFVRGRVTTVRNGCRGSQGERLAKSAKNSQYNDSHSLEISKVWNSLKWENVHQAGVGAVNWWAAACTSSWQSPQPALRRGRPHWPGDAVCLAGAHAAQHAAHCDAWEHMHAAIFTSLQLWSGILTCMHLLSMQMAASKAAV